MRRESKSFGKEDVQKLQSTKEKKRRAHHLQRRAAQTEAGLSPASLSEF
jgi:hypothetical protein